MQDCSMPLSASVPTQAQWELLMKASAPMVVQGIAQLRCAEVLNTSTSSILMHIKLQLTILAAETPFRTPTTKSGTKTWDIAKHQVSHITSFSNCLLLQTRF